MTLVNLAQVLEPAHADGRGLAAFNVIQIEHAEAFAAAAEQVGLPVVMQMVAGDRNGDGHLSDVANRAETRRVVELCRTHGVSVEAELGEVGGKDGVHAPGVRTDPGEAAWFVADTGVDALAVAVGSSHAMTDRTARLDTDLIAALRESVPVPLVLHGSSGVADDGLVAAERAGMTKVNIATHLNQVFTRAMLGWLENAPTVDTRKYLGAARDAVADEAARLMRLLATP